MKLLRFTALFATIALSSAVHADEPHTLRFLNGDMMTGKPDAIDRHHVTWQAPALKTPARFLADQIRHLQLPSKIHLPERTDGHEATLTLTNGDDLRGQLESVTDDEITLDTWYAGQLVFRRVMVRDLSIREMPEYVYRGPDSIDAWTQTGDPPAWSMTDEGAYISNAPGSIAREMPLPDELTIEFEAQWQGSFRLHLILFSDDPETDSPDNGYEVVFQRQSVHIRRCGQRQWIGHSNRAIELQQNEKARIRIRASARTGQFAFYVNDHIIDAWTDDDIDADKLGSAIHFISRDNSPLVISRLDISHWNGILDEQPDAHPMVGRMDFRGGLDSDEPQEEAEDPDDGSMVLRNGDRIRGIVKAIEDGLITIDTSFREISLPVERLRTVALKPVDLEEPKRENGDIRAWFTDGGSMVFRLEGVSEDGARVQGYSQTFGNATFDLSAFNRLEFNIYDLFRAEH